MLGKIHGDNAVQLLNDGDDDGDDDGGSDGDGELKFLSYDRLFFHKNNLYNLK